MTCGHYPPFDFRFLSFPFWVSSTLHGIAACRVYNVGTAIEPSILHDAFL